MQPHILEFLTLGLNKKIMIKIVYILKNGFLNCKLFQAKTFTIGLKHMQNTEKRVLIIHSQSLTMMMLEKILCKDTKNNLTHDKFLYFP
jgi:hypothetical protein